MTNIILRAYNDFPLTIVLSNLTWGFVTMSTGTITEATVVRVPNTVESAVTKTNVANGLTDYLNLAANTTALDQTATVASELVGLGNAQTISGAKVLTGNIDFTAAGVRVTGDGDGALTLLGLGNGADEDLTINLDDTANQVVLSSSTGVTNLTLSGIDLRIPDIAYDATLWNGSTLAPTMNAIRDKIETMGGLGTADIDTSAELKTIVTDETGTGGALVFADSPVFVDDITIHATGVKLTGDGDGALTFLGLGNGSDEDFTINLDDTADTAVITSSTGLNKFDFQSIDVQVPDEAYDATGWDSDLTVPTKNAVRDKIEALIVGGGLGTGDIDTSAEIRGIVGDESGTGALIFAGGDIGAAIATTASANDNDTSVATTAYVQTELTDYASDAITFTTKKITWSAALGSDDTYEGSQIVGLNNSGGVTQWDTVYLNSSSQWVLADANGSGTYPARGIVAATQSTGVATIVITSGTIRNDAWSWTIGGTIYLSVTAGGMTQTPPATTGDKVQVIGYALTADIMAVAISADYGTAP